jgi:hypothetical protein
MNFLSLYRPNLLRPGALTALSTPLLLCCGVMAILSWAAPDYLQTVLPGWREKWGLVLIIAVAYGFCRAVIRLMFRAAGVVFWSVAVACLLGTSLHALPESFKALHLPKFSIPLGSQEKTPEVSQAAKSPRTAPLSGNRGAPALPDEAYFGAAPSALPSQLSIPPQMNNLLRRFNLR